MLSTNGNADAGVDFAIDGVIAHPLAESGVDFSKCPSNAQHTCAACDPNSGLDAAACPNKDNPYGLEVTHDVALIHLAPNIGGDGLPHAADFSTYPRLRVLTDITTASGGTPYTLHAAVPTSDFSASTRLTVIGWGRNDLGTTGQDRFAGQMRIPDPGDFATFIGPTSGPLGNCWDALGSDGGLLYWYSGDMAHVARLDVDGGSFNGPCVDGGDSGSPLLVQGGSGPDQIAHLPTNEWIVFGDLWGGNILQVDGPIEAGDFEFSYAPSMLNGNGQWLDTHLVDFDGDGTPDYMDNCPVVPNDQANANFDAERALQQRNVDAGIDGHTPTSGDPWDYVEWWRRTFPGDACDTIPTTTGSAPYKFDDTNEDAGQCNVLYIYQGQGSKIDVDASGTTCPKVATSGLKFQSWVGTPYGDAVDDAGTSVPSWCSCPLSSALQCSNNGAYDCKVAVDSALPYSNLNSSITPSLWKTMSVFGTPPESLFTNEATTHQDPSPLHAGPFTSVRTDWDFRNDFPSSTSLDGPLWTHVYNFAGGGALTSGINNHYQMSHVELDNGWQTVQVPTNILTFVPIWVKVEWNSSDPATFALFGQDSVSLALHTVIADGTGAVDLLADSTFTSAAQAQLLNVASGAQDLLFADDLVGGALGHQGPRAGLLLTAGTPEVRGAVSYLGPQIDGASATTSAGSPPSVLVRAFSSANDQLYWIVTYFTHYGATLYVQDLASSFDQRATDTISSFETTGDIPGGASAVTWNAGAHQLYVLDWYFDSGVGDYTLRLLALTLYGEGHELWRTAALGGDYPTNIFLSSGPAGQVVVGLTHNQTVEFAVFDEAGNPVGSYTVPGPKTLQVPIVFNNAGATLGMTGITMTGAPTPFGGSSVAPSDLAQTICGTSWLRNVVDTTTTNLLSFALSACP